MQKWYSLYRNILHLHFSEGFYQLPESAKNAASPTNPVMRLLKVAGYMLVRLIGNIFHSPEHPEKLQNKVWLYVVSQNNYDSLKFISISLQQTVMVAGQNKEIGKYNQHVERISLRGKILYYYKFLPLLLYFYRKKRKHTIRFFDILFDAVGFYEIYLRKLRKYKPACVVFANDHTPDARAMLLAAKNLGIKTIYIQHASVSKIFPPLQFDLSLLEGEDSLEKYKACGPVSGRVEFIGMPKFDAYINYRNTKKKINTIGIGANLMDRTEEIQEALTKLTQAFPELNIILRPHPRDKRDFSFTQNLSDWVSFSDSRQVPVFDFLKQIDVLIAGNSGIHLEAVLLNVWSIFYNFNSKENLRDYYGYVINSLSDHATSPEQLVQMIQQHLFQRPDVYTRTRYFNATVGTEWDGRSSELAINQIRSIL